MKKHLITAGRSRHVQLAILGVFVIVAAVVWTTRPSRPVIAIGEADFGDLATTIEADLFDKHGCAEGELAISTPNASGYGSVELDDDGSLPDDLIELFERRIHEFEHVTDYRVGEVSVLLLAHDRPNLYGRHSGVRLLSTLTEIVSLTGGAAGVQRWEVVQSLVLVECTEDD